MLTQQEIDALWNAPDMIINNWTASWPTTPYILAGKR